MREILFRGKITQDKWVYGFYKNVKLEEEGIIHYVDSKIVSSKTVGQFTGLTDKNGTKIFEGDIVKGCWNTIFEVYFDDCYLQYRAKAKGEPAREIDYYGENYRLEVIGNINDNPELLEKGE